MLFVVMKAFWHRFVVKWLGICVGCHHKLLAIGKFVDSKLLPRVRLLVHAFLLCLLIFSTANFVALLISWSSYNKVKWLGLHRHDVSAKKIVRDNCLEMFSGFIMTSRRQRRQPNHHIIYYAYPTGVFDDDFSPVTGESLVGVPSSSNIQDAHQSIFECDAHSDSDISDLSAIASSSFVPSLQSEMNQTGNASMIGPSSSKIFSLPASSNQAREYTTLDNSPILSLLFCIFSFNTV
ncbi:hypothetical protein SADUNF_Sadunf11G0051400 [Salix dunnii]|uniref:Uncharacterized protein n=1 Tax=Salix dunnii TaxID=1413687 RepID=A0A835JNQ3_9ROSI|nr:hypothetical protein SADUNF_Sadunf11G0051400 [Salix dunnii]